MARIDTTRTKRLFDKQTYGLDFTDVVSNRVVVSDVAAHRVETLNTFSWSIWAMLNTWDNNVLPRLFEKGAQYLCMMGNSTNGKYKKLALETEDSSANVTESWGGTALELQRWYHVVVTFNDGVVNIYIDGVTETISKIGATYVSPLASTVGSDVKIGNAGGSNRNWSGRLSDARWYNVVLTSAEVLQLYNGENVTRGLVSRWIFDENTGSTATDSVGGYNGIITGADWVTISQVRSSVSERASAGSRTTI